MKIRNQVPKIFLVYKDIKEVKYLTNHKVLYH